MANDIKKNKKSTKKVEKKSRWDSIKRHERDVKKYEKAEKPDKIRWILTLKKIKEMKAEHKKKRQARAEKRKILIEKGVIKQK